MEMFGSGPQSEPEPSRTERWFRVRVRELTRTRPTVPFWVRAIRAIPEPLRTRSERVRTRTVEMKARKFSILSLDHSVTLKQCE
jgi:hypothetical protein